MTDIQVSLHGKRFGLGANNELVIEGNAVANAPTKNAGSVNTLIDGISVEEKGNGIIHETVISLVDVALAVVSVTTGNGVGGALLYTFPQGYIHVLGSYASIDLSIAAAKQADFTDGTPEGQIGIGSLLPANADALGTDATDDNICTAADFTMASYDSGVVPLRADAATLVLDGHTTAEDVNLTLLVDAADIDDGTTSEVLANGTVTVRWLWAGDV